MPFVYLKPEKVSVNTALIKKGDAFLVRDNKDVLPFKMEVIDETSNALLMREWNGDGQPNHYWILREDLPNYREFIDSI